MTDHAALKDEELIRSAIWAGRDDEVAATGAWAFDRLIAALRASRRQIAVLEARLASAERMRAASFDRAERLVRGEAS